MKNGNVFQGNDKQAEVRQTTAPAGTAPIGKYFYDGSGARIKKVVGNETTVFVYDAGGALAAEYSTQTVTNPTTSYMTTDHLGSPRVITDKLGNVISRRDFMPFGEELSAGVGGRNETQKYSYTGSDNIRKRFTGYEKDDETQLDFAEARMYQNKHGRFTAVDPLLASGQSANPQTFNRYVYVANNPIVLTDPTGMSIDNPDTMSFKELDKQFARRQNGRKKSAHSAVTPAFFRPPRDCQHRSFSGHRQNRRNNQRKMTQSNR